MKRNPDDPTRVRVQPALTTSSGRRWLLWGGLLAGISCVVLAVLAITRVPAAWVAVAVIVALYAAMVIVRVTVTSQHARLLALAWLMGITAVIALVSVVLVGAVSAGGV